MQKLAFQILLLASLVSLSACATIMNDKTQKINVTTSTGREIEGTVDGMPFKAPSILEVTRHKQDKIFVTNDPKCNQSTIAPKSIDSVFWVNIITGGVFGSTTDYASEEMWKYQDTVTITCKS